MAIWCSALYCQKFNVLEPPSTILPWYRTLSYSSVENNGIAKNLRSLHWNVEWLRFDYLA